MSKETKKKISIFSAGAWGSALANAAAKSNGSCILFDSKADVVADINNNHRNARYTKDSIIDSRVRATSNVLDIIDSDIILLTSSAAGIESSCRVLQESNLNSKAILVSCAKGMYKDRFVSSIIKDYFTKDRICVLSGPSFASEVINYLYTGVEVAGYNFNNAALVAKALSSESFICHASDDVVGLEICGLYKNIIALFCGILFGGHYGRNAMAYFMHLGSQEMSKLVSFYKGKQSTVYGLAGIGDLMLTASSDKSRNFKLGHLIGHAGSYSESIALDVNGVKEGLYSSQCLKSLSNQAFIELSIVNAVWDILYNNQSVDSVIKKITAYNNND